MHRSGRQGATSERRAGARRHRTIDLGREPLDFAEFLELVPDAIVLADRSGNIVHTNRPADELFGYEPEQLVGEPVETLIPTRLLTLHVAHRERYFHDPRRRPMGIGLELHGRRRDGTEFPAEISLAPIETPRGLLVAAAVRDLTERVQAEERRKELEAEAFGERELSARRLESIGELAGGIAHDFNNVLMMIIQNAQYLLGRTSGESRELIEEVIRAAEHGTELTSQLLLFGRPQSGDEIVDLNAVIFDVERLLRRTIGAHIDLRVRPDPSLAPVRAGRGQLEQILLNLAINARDAMPDGGGLTIQTAVAGTYACLTVADEGVGMERDVAARAFEPYFTTKPEDTGTGLGLATVAGIVHRFDGRVTLRSEPDRGTVVHVFVPLAEPGTTQLA